MTKSKRRMRVGGAVLVMVLIVMVVLIMMLMATLTVVTSAGQRIYTKYEENQAYYSARSALDIFTQNMLEDNMYYAYDSSGVRLYEFTPKKSGDPSSAKMKQGLALQLELYKIKSQGQKTREIAKKLYPTYTEAQLDAITLSFAENAAPTDEVFGAGTKENLNYSISTPELEYIEYTVKLPDIANGGSSGYGGLADEGDTNGDGVPDAPVAIIKVEVLDRIYGTAASYGNNENEIREKLIQIIEEGDPTKLATLKNNIKTGDRSKDIFTLKVTSTVKYEDTTGTAVLIYDASPRPQVNSNRAITTVNDISQGSGVFPIGGASSLSTGEFYINQGAVAIGDMFLKGSLKTDGGSNTYMFKETVHTIFGNVSFQDSYFDFKQAGSTLFSQGTVDLALNSSNYGEYGMETNIVASTVKFTGNGRTLNYYGNIYSDVLALGLDGVAMGCPTVSGSVYTNYVDMTENFPTVTASSNVISMNTDNSNIYNFAPKINVAKGFVLNYNDGTGVAPAKYEWDGTTTLTRTLPDGSIHVITIATDSVLMPTFASYNAANEIKINYYDPTHYEYEDDNKIFTLPVALAGHTGSGANELTVPTVKSLYKDIFKDTAFVNDSPDLGKNGELNSISMPTFDASSVVITYNDFYGAPVGVITPAFVTKFLEDDLSSLSDWEVNNKIDEYVNTGVITAEEGNMIKSNWNDNTISWWPTIDVQQGVKSAIINGVEAAKLSDTTYQADLAAYYQNYITGSEKAGETSCADLLKYKSDQDPITIKNVSDLDAESKKAFTVGGDYEKLSSSTQIIDTSGYLKSGTQYGTYANPVIIDARSNDLIIQLGAENGMGPNQERGSKLTFKGYFVVVGDKTVKVYLPDGRDYTLGSTASGQGFYLSTYDVHIANDIKLGTQGTRTPSPNVYMYAGNNVKNIFVEAPGIHRMIAAHIYVPFANYDMSGAADSGAVYSGGVTYNGVDVGGESTFGYSVVGSLIASSYASNNKTGVAYISPDADSTPEGDPHLTWQPQQYARK